MFLDREKYTWYLFLQSYVFIPGVFNFEFWVLNYFDLIGAKLTKTIYKWSKKCQHTMTE